ncbi:hypothetical protein HYC85_026054 [Camellia sinensis]|uniref:Telomere-associated protein Rif1 N-terminal domain-containing protein n=1 Tax=Camellia sinensis TaxID=4442 RepID=A0A7J7G3N3_CAMSI|nr:hypothetical protein HYC85_026054 [Camellia sinensis]
MFLTTLSSNSSFPLTRSKSFFSSSQQQKLILVGIPWVENFASTLLALICLLELVGWHKYWHKTLTKGRENSETKDVVLGIAGDDANLIVDSLTKVIITTRMKSVCNLGVWCISIQQFDASYLTPSFHSLLRAIVHALDNPIGSLSTTFEAIQSSVWLISCKITF